MSLSDPIGDMFSRIKNAQMRNHKTVELPSSNFKVKISEILKSEGFISDYKVNADSNKSVLSINLKNNPILSMKQIICYIFMKNTKKINLLLFLEQSK